MRLASSRPVSRSVRSISPANRYASVATGGKQWRQPAGQVFSHVAGARVQAHAAFLSSRTHSRSPANIARACFMWAMPGTNSRLHSGAAVGGREDLDRVARLLVVEAWRSRRPTGPRDTRSRRTLASQANCCPLPAERCRRPGRGRPAAAARRRRGIAFEEEHAPPSPATTYRGSTASCFQRSRPVSADPRRGPIVLVDRQDQSGLHEDSGGRAGLGILAELPAGRRVEGRAAACRSRTSRSFAVGDRAARCPARIGS